jgi:DNA-binding CsgD family transcriptional regulator/PAS domain-containing protein
MKIVSHSHPVSDRSAVYGAGDCERLSDLISSIYDAALEPSLWEGAIERVTYFVQGAGAGLFFKDVDAQHVFIPHSFGVQWPLPVDLFRQIYPAAVGHFRGDIEQLISTRDLMPFNQLTQTGFYEEWARPRGLVDFVSAVLDKSATSAAVFGVFRHERHGPFDSGARRRLRLIVPHIRRAVLIARMFDLKLAESATLSETLDGLRVSMFLVNAEGRLAHANAAALAMLEAGDIFRTASGRLSACDPQDDRALRDVFAAAGQGDAALGAAGTAMPLVGKSGKRYLAHTLPLTSGARRRAGISSGAAAALFVRDADLLISSRSEVIAKTFKLTPTELRVLLAIVEVGGVPEVAAALGVADTTVRTHVGRLFEKTGATRQADLVKLVAGYRSPLEG